MRARWLVSRRLLPPLLYLALALACSPRGGADSPAYIALGDSLSEGVGASDPTAAAFVPLVRRSLGEGFELLNLGHSGDTSHDLLDHGHLDEAIAQIQERNGDDDQANDVKLVTLEIGGNDLLRIYFSLVITGTCPDLETSLQQAECVDALASALQNYEPNLRTALDRLQEADPSVPIVLLTLYNPFSGSGTNAEIGELALEGLPDTPFPEGLNDIIRAQAGKREVILADVYPLFEGRAPELISGDLIHPNDQGYRVIADAVLGALGATTAAPRTRRHGRGSAGQHCSSLHRSDRPFDVGRL